MPVIIVKKTEDASYWHYGTRQTATVTSYSPISVGNTSKFSRLVGQYAKIHSTSASGLAVVLTVALLPALLMLLSPVVGAPIFGACLAVHAALFAKSLRLPLLTTNDSQSDPTRLYRPSYKPTPFPDDYDSAYRLLSAQRTFQRIDKACKQLKAHPVAKVLHIQARKCGDDLYALATANLGFRTKLKALPEGGGDIKAAAVQRLQNQSQQNLEDMDSILKELYSSAAALDELVVVATFDSDWLEEAIQAHSLQNTMALAETRKYVETITASYKELSASTSEFALPVAE